MFTCIPQLPLVMTWQVYLHVSNLKFPQNINALFKKTCSHLAYKSQDSDLHSHHPPRTDPSTLPGMGQGSAALGSNGRCSPPTSAQPLPSPSNIFQHNLKGLRHKVVLYSSTCTCLCHDFARKTSQLPFIPGASLFSDLAGDALLHRKLIGMWSWCRKFRNFQLAG